MSKVECQCCKKMMVPKVITSAPFYISGVPVGGRDPESSVCPFCLSPKWMLTEHQALAAGKANAEFYGLMVLALVTSACGVSRNRSHARQDDSSAAPSPGS